MEFFSGQPFFQVFAGGSVEFHQHFSFLQVEDDAATGDGLGGGLLARHDAAGQFFGSLAGEAGERVLRKVAPHWGSWYFCTSAAEAARFPGCLWHGSSRALTEIHETTCSDAVDVPSDTLGGEKKQMVERRTAHPYYLYEAIQAQPALIERTLGLRAAVERAADAMAEKQRVIFMGIGTSRHAALVAEGWTREFTAGRMLGYAEQSFELVHHPMALSDDDAVVIITHTGTTTYSVEALRAARAARALTIAITGEASGEGVHGADFHIETCEQEISFAYTKSYTTALAAIALLILRIAERRQVLAASATFRAGLERVPQLMRQALMLEPQVRELAKRAAKLERMWVFGSGAGWATAREAALKIKESCYLAAEGFDTEEILHGPFSEVDARGSLVGMLSGRASDERARMILRAGGELKMLRAAIVTPTANRQVSAEHTLVVPEAEEWQAAFVHLVPLQLLTYFVALERGTNPDSGRQEQAAHAAAAKHYKY